MTQFQAILCALAAFFGWVFWDVAVKLAAEASLSPLMIMAIMGSVGTVGIIGTALGKQNIALLRPHHPRRQALVALCAVANNFTGIIALKHLPLTVFYIVVFSAPLAIAVLSAALKHESLTRTKIICVVAGFIGVVIAIAPGLAAGGEWIGYAAGAVNVLCFAVYTITIRTISQTDSMESIQLTNTVAMGVIGIVGSLPLTAALSARAVVIMIAGSALNLIGCFLYSIALRHTSATNVAQVHYTQIISGAVLAYLIWHELPTWNLAAGSVLIIASGIMVAAQAHKAPILSPPAAQAPL